MCSDSNPRSHQFRHHPSRYSRESQLGFLRVCLDTGPRDLECHPRHRLQGPGDSRTDSRNALFGDPAFFLRYDAIIVGSGFGAAAAAARLVEAGLSTLLLERGRSARRDALDGDQRQILGDKRYRSPSPMRVRQYGNREYETQYPNEVLGGMSVLRS